MRTFLGFVTLALLSGFVQAEGFDYNYVEVGYVNAELDTGGIDVDGDGFGINGSFGIANNYLVFAEYSSLGFDFSVDLNQLAVGGGAHFALSQTIDFVGTLSYRDVEVESAGIGISEDGFGIGAGLRGALGDSFEWEASIDYSDIGDGDTSFGVDGRYYFTDSFAAGAGITIDDDVTIYAIGVRMEFGQ